MPYVASVSSFVVYGGEITGLRAGDDGRTALDLAEPGSWFDPLREARFVTPPGGPWTLWGAADAAAGRPWRGMISGLAPTE